MRATRTKRRRRVTQRRRVVRALNVRLSLNVSREEKLLTEKVSTGKSTMHFKFDIAELGRDHVNDVDNIIGYHTMMDGLREHRALSSGAASAYPSLSTINRLRVRPT